MHLSPTSKLGYLSFKSMSQTRCRYHILSRQASLTRQAVLITSLHGSHSKTGKRLLQKSSAMKSYVKLMRHLPVKRPVFPTVPLIYAKD